MIYSIQPRTEPALHRVYIVVSLIGRHQFPKAQAPIQIINVTSDDSKVMLSFRDAKPDKIVKAVLNVFFDHVDHDATNDYSHHPAIKRFKLSEYIRQVVDADERPSVNAYYD